MTAASTADPPPPPVEGGYGVEPGELPGGPRSYEAERDARNLADKQQQRFAFLAEVSTLLASSLDQEPTLRHLLDLAVPNLGDQCGLVLLSEDGTSLRRTSVFGDPDLERRIEETERRVPLDLGRSHPLSWVLSRGQPLLIEAVVDSLLASLARDEPHLLLLRSMGLRSMMILPLSARGRTFGAMTFTTSTSRRRYDEADLTFALDFARRAAMAIDNARLYEQAQRALRERDEAAALLDTLFTTAPIGLAFIDRELRYTHINHALAEMNGLPPEAHLGKTPVEIVPGLDDLPAILDGWRRILATGEPMPSTEVSGETPAAPGRKRHWLSDFYPVRVHGETIGLGIVCREITERKRADAERDRLLATERKVRAEAEEAKRAREELLAIVAHDLRNPLGVIVMGATLLERVATPEELGRFGRRTKMIRQAAERMGSLIRDLLDAASIEAGGLSLEPRTHSLHGLVGDAVEFFTPLAEQRSIQLDKALLCEDTSVVCDGERVQQVLANLLGNALKFTPEGGFVTVRAQVFESEICVEVEDTGPGIQRELLPLVFDRYRSGKRSSGGGTGLGLYIAKGIVEGHHGTIDVRSRAGVGTTFFFTLPLRSPSTPEPPSPSSGRGGAGPSSA